MKKIFLLALTLGALFAISGCSSPSGGSPDDKPSYTVTFDPNGGSGTMQAQTIVGGTTAALTANAFTKAGVSFAGWATTSTDSVSYPDRASYTMGGSNVTLYAIWTTLPSYTVTFDPNGGSGSMTAQSIVSGATATLSANTFTKSGAYFAGWSTTKTGSVDYTDGARYPMGTANATLYAIWTTTPSYTVTFNANTGSGTMATQSIVSSTAANLSANIFTKTGYSFKGWSTTTTGPVSYTDGASYPMGTENVTLYAIWQALPSYTITFDANGGSGSMTPQSIVSGASANLSANKFTNTGHSFVGWSITKPGSVDYTNGARYTMGSANVTLYAIWEIDNGLVYTLINNGTEYQVSCGTFAGTTLTIPEYYGGKKVTAVATFGFQQKKQLTSISLPSSITSIGTSAFEGCSELTGDLIIPSSVTYIGAYAFNECSGLTGTLTIPSGVKTIGQCAFSECSGLTGTLTIPASVTSIGAGAFASCRGLSGDLTIPSSVTSIKDSAFQDCSGLTGSLTIPSSVTTIGASAFSGCGFTGTLTIPSNVTSIGRTAFGYCSKLTGDLTIPGSVTSIGECAFIGCTGLNGSLTIYEGLTSIEYGAFERCSGLSGSLTIPGSVTSIGECAFQGCTGLNGSLTISKGVTSIGEHAFESCRGLTGPLTIPEGVTSIEKQAFYDCSGLTGSLTLPGSVKSIGDNAFSDCTGLTGPLTIPEGVTSIGYYAFDEFSGTVTINAITPPNLIRRFIFDNSKITEIKVPAASVDAYKAADGWPDYATKISAQEP